MRKRLNRISALLLAVAASALAASNAYIQHNLVADQKGVADVTDPNLINPWGIALSSGGPFWVSDNGTGLATVYSTTVTSTVNVSSLVVTVPAGGGGKNGPVSGQLSNTASPAFAKASFIFCTEDGTISTWAGGSTGTVQVDNSTKGAVYKGMVIGGTTAAPQLYVANFHNATVEVYDGNFAPVSLPKTAFTDTSIPTGFAPFNIANFNGSLYVAFAKQDSAGMDDVAGPGNGYVDVFDMSGNLTTHLIAGGPLNSPWGMAIAPANFGPFSNMLLVGNFGDGQINAFDPLKGTAQGALQSPAGAAIKISGLWALTVGNGKSGGDANAVYFSAGSGGEAHGLLGSLQAAPVLPSGNPVINGASFLPGITEYGWMTIKGFNLSSTTRLWNTSDFKNGALPTQLDGVGVTVDGRPAYIYYVSPSQINALIPADATLGNVQLSTTNQTLSSNSTSVPLQTIAPAFFITKNNYGAALHADNTVVGPTTLYPNNSTPAKPGETIALYGTGFGSGVTTIPDGQIIATPINVSGVTVSIGGASAQVTFAGLVEAGVYQINVIVPSTTPNGDATLTANIAGQSTQSGVLLNVQQ